MAGTGLEVLYLTEFVRRENLDGTDGFTCPTVGLAARILTVSRMVGLPKTAVTVAPTASAAAAQATWTK